MGFEQSFLDSQNNYRVGTGLVQFDPFHNYTDIAYYISSDRIHQDALFASKGFKTLECGTRIQEVFSSLGRNYRLFQELYVRLWDTNATTYNTYRYQEKVVRVLQVERTPETTYAYKKGPGIPERQPLVAEEVEAFNFTLPPINTYEECRNLGGTGQPTLPNTSKLYTKYGALTGKEKTAFETII